MITQTAKEKFFLSNRDIFIKYFDSDSQYNSLISRGEYKQMERIIRDKSQFSSDEWIKEFFKEIIVE